MKAMSLRVGLSVLLAVTILLATTATDAKADGTPLTQLWPIIDTHATTGRLAYVPFDLKAESATTQVWVQQDLSFPPGDPRATPTFTDEQAAYLLEQFDTVILPQTTEFFGTPQFRDGLGALYPVGASLPLDYYYDSLGRQIILVANNHDDGYYGPTGGTGGHYLTEIRDYTDRNVVTIDPFVRPGPWFGPPDYHYEGVLAHEFTHLIQAEHYPGSAPGPTKFISEGLAMFSEERVSGYPGTVPFDLSQAAPNPENSLVLWDERGDYGQVYLFILYLYEQFGPECVKSLFHSPPYRSPLEGIAAIEAALSSAGSTRTFGDVYRDWAIALAIDSSTPGDGIYQFENADFQLQLGTPETPNPEATGLPGAPAWGTDYIWVTADANQEPSTLVFDGADCPPSGDQGFTVSLVGCTSNGGQEEYKVVTMTLDPVTQDGRLVLGDVFGDYAKVLMLVTANAMNTLAYEYQLEDTTYSISGTVYASSTGLPLGGGLVLCYEASDYYSAYGGAVVAADGSYTIDDLEPGEYYLRTSYNSAGYANEWYGGLPTYWYWFPDATVVTVEDEAVTGIDFHLELGGSICGIVMGDDGSPVPGGFVFVYSGYRGHGFNIGWPDWSGSGYYSTDQSPTALPPGEYRLRTRCNILAGYADQELTITLAEGEDKVVDWELHKLDVAFGVPQAVPVSSTSFDVWLPFEWEEGYTPEAVVNWQLDGTAVWTPGEPGYSMQTVGDHFYLRVPAPPFGPLVEDGTYNIWIRVAGHDFYDQVTLEPNTEGTQTEVELPGEVSVEFSSVSAAGYTSVTVVEEPPELPGGFEAAGGCYELTTTAEYEGEISVCFPYDPDVVSNPRILHYEDGIWVDVTTTVDEENGLVYGVVTSLSPFVVAAPPTLTELRQYLTDEVTAGNISPQLEVSLLAKVDAALAAIAKDNANAAKVAINNLQALKNQVEAQTGKKIDADTSIEILDRIAGIVASLGG